MNPPNLALVVLLGVVAVAGCATTEDAPEPTGRVATVDGAPANDTGDTGVDSPSGTAPEKDDGSEDAATATSGKAGGGLVFNVKYRVPANQVCSHDRETGSHFEKAHCRSAAAARDERAAAQEFLHDRMRKSR